MEDFLDPLNITAYRLSKAIGVDQSRISNIIKGERKISVDTALRLSKFFGMSENYWINLQSTYEILETKRLHARIIDNIKPFDTSA